ncbi:MAG: methyltransferase domain-containing protein, partial [Spirochaetaceae bacterium]|nr:methyltransferase domain-containing protein [Spirochaetaceae bacterium]
MKHKTEHKKILVLASFEKGRGTGHLVRAGALVSGLRTLGCDTFLFVQHSGMRALDAMEIQNRIVRNIPLITENEIHKHDWYCVIFDRFATPPAEFSAVYAQAPLIAVDEGGALRDSFDFVIDALPNIAALPPANALRPDLLPMPQARRPDFAGGFFPHGNFLISFGGEDSANLGIQAASVLRKALPDASITLVSNRKDSAPKGITAVSYIDNLRENLASFDAVITHYGITAFEAAYARCAVALVSPSLLHEKLARTAGFLSAGTGSAGIQALERLGKTPGFWDNAARLTRDIALRYFDACGSSPKTLAEYINLFDITVFRICPVCGNFIEHTRKTRARFSTQTFIECPHCSMFIQHRFSTPPIEYDERYFFEMYQKQYGKTYLEDFPHLISAAKSRLCIIKKIASKNKFVPGTRLLDIGCAYGAFLQAAHEEGFQACGIDPSAPAVDYVRGTLNIQAYTGFFPDGIPENIFSADTFDCVSMWFVIEHLRDVPAALSKVKELLKSGGIFSFSTPSGSGISARKGLAAFLAKSPADHWAVWKPAAVRRLLRRFGFTVKKIRITGHHPERFGLCPPPVPGSFWYKVILLASRILRLGDTFEVYAALPAAKPAAKPTMAE